MSKFLKECFLGREGKKFVYLQEVASSGQEAQSKAPEDLGASVREKVKRVEFGIQQNMGEIANGLSRRLGVKVEFPLNLQEFKRNEAKGAYKNVPPSALAGIRSVVQFYDQLWRAKSETGKLDEELAYTIATQPQLINEAFDQITKGMFDEGDPLADMTRISTFKPLEVKAPEGDQPDTPQQKPRKTLNPEFQSASFKSGSRETDLATPVTLETPKSPEEEQEEQLEYTNEPEKNENPQDQLRSLVEEVVQRSMNEHASETPTFLLKELSPQAFNNQEWMKYVNRQISVAIPDPENPDYQMHVVVTPSVSTGKVTALKIDFTRNGLYRSAYLAIQPWKTTRGPDDKLALSTTRFLEGKQLPEWRDVSEISKLEELESEETPPGSYAILRLVEKNPNPDKGGPKFFRRMHVFVTKVGKDIYEIQTSERDNIASAIWENQKPVVVKDLKAYFQRWKISYVRVGGGTAEEAKMARDRYENYALNTIIAVREALPTSEGNLEKQRKKGEPIKDDFYNNAHDIAVSTLSGMGQYIKKEGLRPDLVRKLRAVGVTVQKAENKLTLTLKVIKGFTSEAPTKTIDLNPDLDPEKPLPKKIKKNLKAPNNA
jgi:hypothetical protein